MDTGATAANHALNRQLRDSSRLRDAMRQKRVPQLAASQSARNAALAPPARGTVPRGGAPGSDAFEPMPPATAVGGAEPPDPDTAESAAAEVDQAASEADQATALGTESTGGRDSYHLEGDGEDAYEGIIEGPQWPTESTPALRAAPSETAPPPPVPCAPGWVNPKPRVRFSG